MNDFYYFIIAGAVLMLVPIFFIAFFQAGFFLQWLRAKGSRGKRVLIKLIKPVRDDFTTGIIEQGFLIFGKKGFGRRIKLAETTRIYHAWGVRAVDIHDELNAPVGTDFRGVAGFDAEAFENLLTRALYRPSLEESKEKIILIGLIIVAVLVIICIGLTWSVQGQVSALGNVGSVVGVV